MDPVILDADELRDALGGPAASTHFSVFENAPLLAVTVNSLEEADRLNRITLPSNVALADLPGAALPCVVVALVANDLGLDDRALADQLSFADVVLATHLGIPPSELAEISAVVAHAPVAATSYAMLLRSAPLHPTAVGASATGSSVAAGLFLESATYSMLQGGGEFAAWRRGRPRRATALHDDAPRVLVARTGQVLTIQLNRPDRHNAFDKAMRDELIDAFDVALADPSLEVVLRATGASFCAGGDLDEFGSRSDIGYAHSIRLTRSVGWMMHQLAPRMTVELHGACMGSGIELPAFVRSIVAAPDTTIGLPELTLGLIPGAGGTVSLPRRIGRHRTAYLGLSNSRITAATALGWGLVDTIKQRESLN